MNKGYYGVGCADEQNVHRLNLHYTGVGSRETPNDILKLMNQVAYRMAELGYTGRSGSAAGADAAFEQGYFEYQNFKATKNTLANFEAYLPWKGFSDITEDRVHIVTPNLNNYQEACDIAATIHPIYHKLKRGAKALHTRNVYQVLGLDLNTPSKVLFCYAQPTYNKQGELTGVKGGTDTAVQLAMRHGIKIYNFYFEEDVQAVKELLKIK